MATATARAMSSTGTLHQFQQLDEVRGVNCRLCEQEAAFFDWSTQQDDRVLREQVPVCKTCASMIVLLGGDYSRIRAT